MSEETSPAYISKVRLKGFKSIIDTECTFKPGLNIIIGDNGSGKSNFLDFLEMAINNSTSDLNSYSSWEIIGQTYNQEIKDILTIKPISPQDLVNNISINERKEHSFFINNGKRKNATLKKFITPKKIQYNLDESYNEFTFPISCKYLVTLPNKGSNNIFIDYINPINKNNFINILLGNIIPLEVLFKEKDFITKPSEINIIKEINRILDLLSNILKRYSNIASIKISNAESRKSNEENIITLENLKFEFKVNNKSLYWHELSDGTKRIFYIISELFASNILKNLVLIEEPELGIHPDQLSKLMNFLKEQSETKQIIISTHSPEVLNHLKRDELDRIIICKHEGEAGTKMYHLEEEEKEHLKEYMVKEGFISDYWVYEGFDIEQEEE